MTKSSKVAHPVRMFDLLFFLFPFIFFFLSTMIAASAEASNGAAAAASFACPVGSGSSIVPATGSGPNGVLFIVDRSKAAMAVTTSTTTNTTTATFRIAGSCNFTNMILAIDATDLLLAATAAASAATASSATLLITVEAGARFVGSALWVQVPTAVTPLSTTAVVSLQVRVEGAVFEYGTSSASPPSDGSPGCLVVSSVEAAAAATAPIHLSVALIGNRMQMGENATSTSTTTAGTIDVSAWGALNLLQNGFFGLAAVQLTPTTTTTAAVTNTNRTNGVVEVAVVGNVIEAAAGATVPLVGVPGAHLAAVLVACTPSTAPVTMNVSTGMPTAATIAAVVRVNVTNNHIQMALNTSTTASATTTGTSTSLGPVLSGVVLRLLQPPPTYYNSTDVRTMGSVVVANNTVAVTCYDTRMSASSTSSSSAVGALIEAMHVFAVPSTTPSVLLSSSAIVAPPPSTVFIEGNTALAALWVQAPSSSTSSLDPSSVLRPVVAAVTVVAGPVTPVAVRSNAATATVECLSNESLPLSSSSSVVASVVASATAIAVRGGAYRPWSLSFSSSDALALTLTRNTATVRVDCVLTSTANASSSSARNISSCLGRGSTLRAVSVWLGRSPVEVRHNTMDVAVRIVIRTPLSSSSSSSAVSSWVPVLTTANEYDSQGSPVDMVIDRDLGPSIVTALWLHCGGSLAVAGNTALLPPVAPLVTLWAVEGSALTIQDNTLLVVVDSNATTTTSSTSSSSSSSSFSVTLFFPLVRVEGPLVLTAAWDGATTNNNTQQPQLIIAGNAVNATAAAYPWQYTSNSLNATTRHVVSLSLLHAGPWASLGRGGALMNTTTAPTPTTTAAVAATTTAATSSSPAAALLVLADNSLLLRAGTQQQTWLIDWRSAEDTDNSTSGTMIPGGWGWGGVVVVSASDGTTSSYLAPAAGVVPVANCSNVFGRDGGSRAALIVSAGIPTAAIRIVECDALSFNYSNPTDTTGGKAAAANNGVGSSAGPLGSAGAVAAIAVGCTIAAVLLAVVVGLIVWRRRAAAAVQSVGTDERPCGRGGRAGDAGDDAGDDAGGGGCNHSRCGGDAYRGTLRIVAPPAPYPATSNELPS